MTTIQHLIIDNATASIDFSNRPDAAAAEEILRGFEVGAYWTSDEREITLDQDAREYLQSLIEADEVVDLTDLENDPADDAAWAAEIEAQDAQQEVYYAAKEALAHALNAFSIDYIIRAAARHNAAEYPTATNTLDVVEQWLEQARAFKDVDHPDYAL